MAYKIISEICNQVSTQADLVTRLIELVQVFWVRILIFTLIVTLGTIGVGLLLDAKDWKFAILIVGMLAFQFIAWLVFLVWFAV